MAKLLHNSDVHERNRKIKKLENQCAGRWHPVPTKRCSDAGSVLLARALRSDQRGRGASQQTLRQIVQSWGTQVK
jgi:hypothetical protein